MSSKVKCTCGWSWNKSDSSKKDMYICHECGRDNSNNMKNGGWLDNYGEEDNYNDSQASAPEGMEGDGYSNVGRNYSPAWGGQFQMGGSVYPVNYVPQAQMGGTIAGAPGFSYARTQGAAPSNGKYAKKTMASAQNGKEMQYYQNGLDFQPKTISKNGSWLSKYDVAQDGDILDKFRDSHPSVRSIQNDAMNRKIQQSKGRGKETTVTQKDNTKTVTPKIGKIATAKEKEQRAIEENKQAQEASELQARKDWVQGSMEEAYKSPLMSPGYFTPEGVAIGALQGATKMGPDLYEGNYKAAAMDAFMALPIAIPAAKRLLSKFTPKQNYTLPEIPSELNLDINQPRFNLNREVRQVAKNKKVPQWKHVELENGIIESTPLRKGLNTETVKKASIPNKGEIELKTYLDSENNPVYYFSANMPGGGLSAGKAYKHLEQFVPKGAKIVEKNSLSTDSFYNILQRAKDSNKFTWTDEGFSALNNAGKNKKFTNSDKIIPGGLNVKFEDFNEAKKALNEFNSRITIEGMPKAKLSTIVDDFQPVENGPWIKKTTFGIDTPNIGLIKNYRQGGIIKDDRGQWDHPGEITEIGSNDITMEGVPYDVLGISDTGDTKLMKPGKNYKFKGKKVTEYPMAKDGLRQEQKGLQNLDNLTNFTNYNKPTIGGWLNKYN